MDLETKSTYSNGRNFKLIARPIASYGIAPVAVGVGFLLRLGLCSLIGADLPTYITFYPAVMVAAIEIGAWGGILATILSAIVVLYWILPPKGSFEIHSIADAVGLVLFLGMGVFISLFAHFYHRARFKAAEYDKELALRESRALLQAISDGSPDPVFVKDRQSRFLIANPATLRAIGRSSREVIGKSDLDHYDDPSIGQAIIENDRRIMESGTGEEIEERMPSPEGNRIFLSTKTPYRDGAGQVIGIIGISRDITARKLAESQIQRQQALLEAINRIFREALTCETEEELGQVCLRTAEQFTESKFGFIGEIDENGFLKDLAISDPGWEACRLPDSQGHRILPHDLKIHGIYGRVIQDGKGFYINAPSSPDDSIGLPDRHPPLDAFLGVPLKRGEKTIGMVAVGNRPGGYRPEDLEALEAMAPAIAESLMKKRAADALRVTAAELSRSNRDLEQFAYVSSHDLQEPLRMVTGFMQLLEKKYQGKLDSTADQYIRFAADGARRMQRLIGDLLEYSRVNTRTWNPAPTDSGEALDQALENLGLSIKESSAQITRGELPTILADDQQLTRVFQNLVGNAIKFRGSRQPEIRVDALREGKRWVFSVRDNGIGIDPEFCDKVFVIFQRLHSRDKYPGTGIGLAISKKIIEQHGGQIWVDSQPGCGSTFYFTMPA
jgi:PAS domain S-box-containing protein